jgi:hypothetical protein
MQRSSCVQQLLRCAQNGCRMTNQTSSPTVASAHGRPPWLAFVGEDTLLVSTDLQDSGGSGEVGEVPHALPTTTSMRSKPDGSCPGIDPVFLAPGLPATTECRPARCRCRRGADDVDSGGSSGVAGTPNVLSSTAAASTAPTTSTPSPRRSRRQWLSRSSTCRIVPIRSTTISLTPRFCLLGALSGRSARRPRL